MAQQTQVRFIDDLDGSEASGTVDFGIDGRTYEIDLSDENAAKLREVFAPFVAAARRLGGTGGRRASSSGSTASTGPATKRNLGKVRTWLRENGYEVKDLGRISDDLVKAFDTKTPASSNDVEAAPANQRNGHEVKFQSA